MTTTMTMPVPETCGGDSGFELRFRSREDPCRVVAFPCDGEGRVDLDRLSREALNVYLYARVFIGRFFEPPSVHGRRAPGLARAHDTGAGAGRHTELELLQG
jgi:hypothetical protein